jgi:FtsP/CotA-like multicopper oxidase with cupredoxin domain
LKALKATFGDGTVPAVDLNALLQKPLFDMNTYGSPVEHVTNGLSLNSKFTASYDMTLGNKLGFFNGGFTMSFTINGQTFPNVPMLTVKMGDLVKIYINNESSDNGHPIHLHGHSFQVIAHNSQPLTGSPITC